MRLWACVHVNSWVFDLTEMSYKYCIQYPNLILPSINTFVTSLHLKAGWIKVFSLFTISLSRFKYTCKRPIYSQNQWTIPLKNLIAYHRNSSAVNMKSILLSASKTVELVIFNDMSINSLEFHSVLCIRTPVEFHTLSKKNCASSSRKSFSNERLSDCS